MGSEVRAKEIESAASSIALRTGLYNLAAGLAGAGITAVIKTSAAPGFATGYTLGVLNIFWLLRIARKGVKMPPDKAGGFVTRRYYIRFLITVLVFALLVSKGIMSPWPLMIGLTGSIFATIIVMVRIAGEEAS